MQIFDGLGQLLFPTRCFGCGVVGISICSTCRSEWHPHYYSTLIGTLHVHSAIIYSPIASKIILAAKENGLKGADRLIIESIIHVLTQAQFRNYNVKLVPIPSSKSARRRRGRSFVVDLTNQIGVEISLPVLDALELTRTVRDQSRLLAKARALNMNGAIALKTGAYPLGDLILIDDVVTTGATLREAARALHSRGFRVLASVTACVAQPLR